MSSTQTILITGAGGQLGSEFRELSFGYPAYEFLFVTREELAIDNVEALELFFAANTIHYCVNCAAYTAVDKAESEKDLALAINAAAVGNLAAICKKYNAGFIHFSTDYVFNGESREPYRADDATSPVNFYGETKLQGELNALKENDKSIIIRTSWVYSSFGKNFVKTMLRLMGEKKSIGVVNDQFGCPTYAADLAAASMQIITHADPVPGIYHYCNEGIINWYEFATAIKEIAASPCIVNGIPTSAYPTPAKRPAYSALNTEKIRSVFGIRIPVWKDSLERCMKLM
ncbi:MAG: dTDP-4-dehydrorhamnose reductase [Ferruginibacter sp.]